MWFYYRCWNLVHRHCILCTLRPLAFRMRHQGMAEPSQYRTHIFYLSSPQEPTAQFARFSAADSLARNATSETSFPRNIRWCLAPVSFYVPSFRNVCWESPGWRRWNRRFCNGMFFDLTARHKLDGLITSFDIRSEYDKVGRAWH